ncbi:gliding motility lipoprotein GldH [Limibacter armeniacum]|uniref:gliding motility lipoprotein GldH n=1 Tax=Limibacter armeniacum TaxID=466084 RepID=UPI002FE61345
MYIRKFLLFAAAILMLAACDVNRVKEEYVNYDDGNWYFDSVAVFDFEILDPSQGYNVDYNLRNSLDYPYHNIFLRYELTDSTGNVIKSDSSMEFMLMDAKTGEPFGETASPKGTGIGVTYTHQIPLLENFHFDKPGKYYFKLKQDMRLDTLSGIYGVGFRVEYND